MGLFGRSKQRLEQAQREAAAELEEAMARAKPPTDAERTWVLPAPDVPDLGIRPPRRQQPRVRFALGQEQPKAAAPPPPAPASDADTEPPGVGPTRRRAPVTKAQGTAKKNLNASRGATKKQPPGTRNRRPT